MDIKGKRVIVTGGANGIGKALVLKLLEVGATVAVLDIDVYGLYNNISKDNIGVLCCFCDVSDSEQVAMAVERVSDKLGAIDILVNNAGIVADSPLIGFSSEGIKRHSVDLWDKIIATNLSSVFYVSSCVAEKMFSQRTRGIIVNVSSISAAGNVGQGAYSAAKAGIRALTTTWAKELGPFGIRVAGIAPGFTETETMIHSMSDDVLANWKRSTPLKRLGMPSEIVDGIMWIIGNDFFHGRTLEIDGGLRM